MKNDGGVYTCQKIEYNKDSMFNYITITPISQQC